MAGLGWQELVIVLVFLLVSVAPPVWIYRDAGRRGESAVGWTILWFVGGFITLAGYLRLRSRRSTPPVGG